MPDYGLGARQRPFDPRELKYRLALSPTTAPDPTRRYSLAHALTRVENQGGIGSCTGNAVSTALEMLATLTGRTSPELSRLWLYWRAREMRNFFDQGRGADTGAFIADACDLALDGCPREALWPYVSDARQEPPPGIDADAPAQDWQLSHRPIYPVQEGAAGVVNAIAQGLPVVIGMAWLGAFYNPVGGVLPRRAARDGMEGGHAIVAWGWNPEHRAVLCRNSWGEGWTSGVTGDPEAGPGDFAIPEEYFTNGVVWEARALSPEPAPLPRREYRVEIERWTWDAAKGDWDHPIIGQVDAPVHEPAWLRAVVWDADHNVYRAASDFWEVGT